MAVVQNPITGRTRKSFSTATFTKNFNQNVMRSKPTQVANPKTIGQTSQRAAFAAVNVALKNLIPLIDIGFKNFQSKMAPFSYASKRSLKEAVSGVAGSRVVDFTKLKISDGKLSPVILASKTYSDVSGLLTIVFASPDANSYDQDSDKIAFGCYTPENGYTQINSNVAVRSEGDFSIFLNKDKVTVNTVFFVFPWSDVPAMATPKVKFKAGAELAGKVR